MPVLDLNIFLISILLNPVEVILKANTNCISLCIKLEEFQLKLNIISFQFHSLSVKNYNSFF